MSTGGAFGEGSLFVIMVAGELGVGIWNINNMMLVQNREHDHGQVLLKASQLVINDALNCGAGFRVGGEMERPVW